jgi:hypothetical protein
MEITVVSSKKSIRLFAFAGFFVLISYRNVYAYIDPGTGSYFLQIIIAGLLGAAITAKVFWKNIKVYISNLFSKEPKGKPDDD